MLSIIVQSIFGIILTVLLIYVWRFVRKTLVYLSFPGPPVDLLLRHQVNEFSDPNNKIIEHRVKWHRRYPRICRFFVGPVGYISVAHPEIIKEIVKAKPPKHPFYKQMLGQWIGEGLLLAGGNKWLRHRRMITPAFHFDILDTFMPIYNESTNVMLSLWEEESQREGYVVLQDSAPYLSLDILLQCIGSLHTNCQVEKNFEYVRDVCDLTQISLLRYTNILYLIDWYFYRTANGKTFKRACQRSHAFIQNLIITRRTALKKNSTSQFNDLLSILLTTTGENGKGLTDQEICDEVNTFVFEGHDTTATGLMWVLYFLAKYPDYQEICRKEIFENVKEEAVKSEDLARLEFFTMFLKESLRLRPPVHTVGRIIEHPMLIDEYEIPKGTLVQLSFYQMHWNPVTWPDPFTFDPYRFSPENIKNIDPYAYLPFSVGERNCIGQNLAMHEIKTVVVKILKLKHLSLHPSISDKEILIKKDILFKPETPLKIVFQELS